MKTRTEATTSETMAAKPFHYANTSNVDIQHNPQFQFAKRHALNLYQKKAIYSFIPKNGCTTLRTSLAVANGFLDEQHLSHTTINWVHNNTYTFSANVKELACAAYRFTVLRCPYDRAVSLFLDKFVDKTPVAWNFYRQTNNIYDLNDMTFTDFIHHLYHHPHLLNGDIHWRRQTDFLVYQDYNDYFEFSDFTTIEKTLKNKLSLKMIDTRGITKHGKDQHEFISDKNHSTTSSYQLLGLKLRGQLPDNQSMLTADLKEIIQKIYQTDFDLRTKKITSHNQ